MALQSEPHAPRFLDTGVPPDSSVLVEAAGDVEAGRGHVVGRRGREPDDHLGHLLGVAAAAERDARGALGLERRQVVAACQLAEEGFDPAYGARPLKRVIQQELQNPLAAELLKGEFPEGSKVMIDFDGTDFTFTSVKGDGAAPRKGGKSGGDKVVAAEVVKK